MKKFINAVIYRHADANEILIDNGVIKAIGKDLGPADEVIDLGGKLVIAPMLTPIYTWTMSIPYQSWVGKGLAQVPYLRQLKCGLNSRRI